MKKNKLLRSVSMICCITMMLSNNIYAQDNFDEVLQRNTSISSTDKTVQKNTFMVSGQLTDKVFNYLTYDDMELIEEKIITLRAENPNVTDKDLDNYVSNLMIQLSNKNFKNKGSGSDFLKPSPEETAYMKKHPREVATYTYCSNMANSEATKRYTDASRWYDGNGDAFRHVFWSASLVKRFYDVLGYSKTNALDASKRWTDVHEPVSDRGSIESKMDVQNNTTGRSIGARLYQDNSYGGMINETQRYIDNGMAVRIGEVNGVRKIVATDKSEKK